jgi:hypothetical protein
MVNIIKEELSLEKSLRNKIEFMCDFTNNKLTIINGSIRKIDKTNLTIIFYQKKRKILLSTLSIKLMTMIKYKFYLILLLMHMSN